MEFSDLLEKMVMAKASDLFLSSGASPQLKVEGKMLPVSKQPLSAVSVTELIYSILSKEQISEFEASSELNMALRAENIGRFRVNVFRQMGEPALVARYINSEIPSIENLGLPVILKDLITEARGLVLLVGGTGTGKSTTLASMIDHRNASTSGHILSIEDPVEFVHEHKKSLVNQREVGLDTESFAVALKNAMREAPDLIMIGEIRDMETMKSAIAYADTGHLCVSTLHANNANQAIDRIVNFFPEDAHQQVLKDLSLNLRAIVSQRLPKTVEGTRVAAVEVMINTPYISDLIEKGEVEKIKKAMIQSGVVGCQTFDNALYDLVKAGKVDIKEALHHADSRNDLSLRFRLEGDSRKTKIKKDVAFAKHVNFDDYQSFSLRQISVADEYSDRTTVLEEAICHTLMSKGLKKTGSKPDLELQYVFSSRSVDPEKLEDVDNAISSGINMEPETKKHGTLKISMVDLDTRKPVWQVSASREIALKPRPQAEINKDMAYLFKEFPPKQLEIVE